jgi:AcrR family transcriptional regulator
MKRGSSASKDALKYKSADWLRFGHVTDPSTKEKMIILTIEQIVKGGPADFNALEICERLQIKAPMVNYYFGNRDGLVAEATWWAYQQWAASVERAFRDAPADPRKRLRAFVEGEVAWAKRMGGMHVLIHYPVTSSQSQQIVITKFQEPMQKLFEFNLALLTVTIRDIQRGTVHSLDFDADSIPRTEFLLTPQYLLKATQISWATHGLASWSCGKHVPTLTLESNPLNNLTAEFAVRQMIGTIVQMADK